MTFTTTRQRAANTTQDHTVATGPTRATVTCRVRRADTHAVGIRGEAAMNQDAVVLTFETTATPSAPRGRKAGEGNNAGLDQKHFVPLHDHH